jgi:small subunit ribosomal protein S17
MAKKKQEENGENTVESTEQEQTSVAETVVEAAASALNTVVERTADVIDVAAGVLGLNATPANGKKESHRAQKVGTVSSDKMTKTVVVSVDRQVMHPKYRRYVRRTTKFMAHDETGAGVGDKVRIEETRPLSARKRWRVVEIIQKATK